MRLHILGAAGYDPRMPRIQRITMTKMEIGPLKRA
jgi:hypothetical protein